MALITDATTVWSTPQTLSTDEVWQTRKGSVFVTTTDGPDDDDGIALHENHGILIAAGQTVRYRKIADTEALIVRETVS